MGLKWPPWQISHAAAFSACVPLLDYGMYKDEGEFSRRFFQGLGRTHLSNAEGLVWSDKTPPVAGGGQRNLAPHTIHSLFLYIARFMCFWKGVLWPKKHWILRPNLSIR